MSLPSHSPLIEYTLENPWPTVVIAAVVGFGVIWIGVSQGLKRPILAGLIIVLASAALPLLAEFIETAGEAITRRTEELVAAAVEGDSEALGRMIAPEARLVVGDDLKTLGRDEILQRAAVIPIAVKSNRVRECRGVATSSTSGESILTQTTQTALAYPVPNEWRFRWRRDEAGQWIVTELIWERIRLNETPSLKDLL